MLRTNHLGRYSKFLVLKVFSLLYRKGGTTVEISRITKMSEPAVRSIKYGNAHTWLKKEYPKQYKLLRQKKNIS